MTNYALTSNQSTVRRDCCKRVLSEQNYVVTCTRCGSRTCPLHTYIDDRNRARCHSCFSVVEEFQPYSLLHYVGSAPRPKHRRKRIVVVFHGLHICGAARHCMELLDLMNEAGYETIMFALAGGGHWGTEFLERSNHLIISRNPGIHLDALEAFVDINCISIMSAHYDPAIKWAINNSPPKTLLYAHFHTEPEFGLFTNTTIRDAGIKCKKLFFPSEATRSAYSPMVGPKTDWWLQKTAIIPNAFPRSLLKATEVGSHDSKLHTELRIGIVTRLDPEKFSLSLFIETINRIRRKRADLSVRVVGGGIISDYIIKMTRSSGLEDCVQFLGWQNDVSSIYKWADVTFLPSISETMPYAAIESMAFGKPVVVPKFGYFSQEAIPSELVFQFEPGNAEQAASFILNATKSVPRSPQPERKLFNDLGWRRIILKQYGLV